jgi:fused signal recognition particle receptor
LDSLAIAIVIGVLLVLAVVGFLVVRSRRPGPPSGPPSAPPSVPPAGRPEPTPPSTLEKAAPPARPDVAVGGLRASLGKTRRVVADRLAALVGRDRLDGEFWQELEDTLIAADLGVPAASRLVEEVRRATPADGAAARTELERRLVALLDGKDRALIVTAKPSVVLVVGVNGTGKTTTIAKLAAHLTGEGSTVLLGAADTFRAAAAEQLRTWGNRVGVDVISAQAGADPASVAYDTYHASVARGVETVLIDTAGRLHSKSNLMDELTKVARVLRREAGEIDEVLLVIDCTTGQNALEQARIFSQAVGVTGIVVTKLDGTSRGGVVVAVEQELGIPVKFIGVGEGMHDLIPFDPAGYVDALLGS